MNLPGSLISAMALLCVGPSVDAQLPTPRPVDPTRAEDYKFQVLADDRFELFVNGESKWTGDAWNRILEKDLSLKRGDVITLSVEDNEGGAHGSLAVLVTRDEALVASSKDFRYTVKPAADFRTAANLQNCRTPDLQPLERSFGLGNARQPKKAWSQKGDRNFGTVHFKFVMP